MDQALLLKILSGKEACLDIPLLTLAFLFVYVEEVQKNYHTFLFCFSTSVGFTPFLNWSDFYVFGNVHQSYLPSYFERIELLSLL